MDPHLLSTIDSADRSLREALVIADLLSCVGEARPLDGTIQEAGFVLVKMIQSTRGLLNSLTNANQVQSEF